MMKQEDLLGKYYKGETSLDEEKMLKEQFHDEENDSSEKDMFGYFQNMNLVPKDLEEHIFSAVKEKQHKSNTLRIRLYSLTSAAAVILIFLSIYLDFRNTKNANLENDFFVIEQALFQISDCIQPDEQEEMFVLWVDNDVEIIIN